jgi:hypothetical protein
VRGKNHRPPDPPRRPQMCDRNDLLALMFSNFWRLQTPRATGKRLEQIIQIIDDIIDDEAWTCQGS